MSTSLQTRTRRELLVTEHGTHNTVTYWRTGATENGRVPVEMALSDESGFPHRGFMESADNRVQSATGSLVFRMVFPNRNPFEKKGRNRFRMATKSRVS